jgi:hypothetical protein
MLAFTPLFAPQPVGLARCRHRRTMGSGLHHHQRDATVKSRIGTAEARPKHAHTATPVKAVENTPSPRGECRRRAEPPTDIVIVAHDEHLAILTDVVDKRNRN